jgi:hypothetical protein
MRTILAISLLLPALGIAQELDQLAIDFIQLVLYPGRIF